MFEGRMLENWQGASKDFRVASMHVPSAVSQSRIRYMAFSKLSTRKASFNDSLLMSCRKSVPGWYRYLELFFAQFKL